VDGPAAYAPIAPEPEPHAVAETAAELVPVPASVFDDEFFRESRTEKVPADGGEEDRLRAPWAEARVPSFAGYAGESNDPTDELDIPAFLRRRH
jgi:cell division protein FtsZ